MNMEKRGHEILQGKGKVRGKLIGGCIEVLDWLRGTTLWPSLDDGKIKYYFQRLVKINLPPQII